MTRFAGKTILFLGSNVGVTDMMRYAKTNGAHTIVADWYPVSKSIPKQLSDEALLVSTADVERLSEIVSNRKIDGVLAGVHEFNLTQAITIADRCNLSFYCGMDQWENVEQKDSFRRLCERYGVPCPVTYFTGSPDGIDTAAIRYPAVLKPVDASASEGVHICHTEGELLSYLDVAADTSNVGRIIVEQYIDGFEFTAHYTLHEGKAKLACVDNRYPIAVHEGSVTTIPVARIYPSHFIDRYIAQVDKAMTKLCEGIGVKEGVLFIQGIFRDKDNSFAVFEAGLRSAGEAPYRFIEKVNGLNYMNLLVDTSLGIEPLYNQANEDPYLKGKCCGVVSLVGRGGTVGSISGLDEVMATIPDIIDYEIRYPVGSKVPDGDTLRQLLVRFVLICESRKRMAEVIAQINSMVKVSDAKGEDMVLRMDPNRVFGCE